MNDFLEESVKDYTEIENLYAPFHEKLLYGFSIYGFGSAQKLREALNKILYKGMIVGAQEVRDGKDADNLIERWQARIEGKAAPLTVVVCGALGRQDGDEVYCNRKPNHVEEGDPWHNMVLRRKAPGDIT